MQNFESARYGLPLLAPGQAQKELFHNEALTLIDFLLQPIAQSMENDPGTLMPEEGQSWIVDVSPVGTWLGKENQIACWSAGGWRFINPIEAMQVMLIDGDGKLIFTNGLWQANAAILEPDGGAVIDVEARDSIESILTALRRVRILPSST